MCNSPGLHYGMGYDESYLTHYVAMAASYMQQISDCLRHPFACHTKMGSLEHRKYLGDMYSRVGTQPFPDLYSLR